MPVRFCFVFLGLAIAVQCQHAPQFSKLICTILSELP